MSNDAHTMGPPRSGNYVVRAPRATDALGHALRHVFAAPPGPDDFARLLRRLDCVIH